MQSYNVKQFEGCAIVQKNVEGLVLMTMTTENDAILNEDGLVFVMLKSSYNWASTIIINIAL